MGENKPLITFMLKTSISLILFIMSIYLGACSFHEEDSEICFIGDSITFAWDLDLFFPNTVNHKFAKNGAWVQTLTKWDLSKCQDKKTVLLIGTNNIGPLDPNAIDRDSVERDLAELYIQLAKKINASTLFAISILPRKSRGQTSETNIFFYEQNETLKHYLKKSSIDYKFIDVFDLFIDENYNLIEPYFKDGVHPNITGYEILSREVRRYL